MRINNKEAEKIAHELSELTGESLTVAVTEAVRERLERLKNEGKKGLADRLLRIGKDCAAHLNETSLTADHATLLYDDQGLPRPRR
jgi:antitoxin VapB